MIRRYGPHSGITMPQPPFAIPDEDTDETAPHQPPVRGTVTTMDRRWLANVERAAVNASGMTRAVKIGQVLGPGRKRVCDY